MTKRIKYGGVVALASIFLMLAIGCDVEGIRAQANQERLEPIKAYRGDVPGIYQEIQRVESKEQGAYWFKLYQHPDTGQCLLLSYSVFARWNASYDWYSIEDTHSKYVDCDYLGDGQSDS